MHLLGFNEKSLGRSPRLSASGIEESDLRFGSKLEKEKKKIKSLI